MKRVYICAPLSDNPNQDVIEAVRFGEYAMYVNAYSPKRTASITS